MNQDIFFVMGFIATFIGGILFLKYLSDSKAVIKIDFSNQFYNLGDLLQGTILIRAKKNINVNAITIQLLCTTNVPGKKSNKPRVLVTNEIGHKTTFKASSFYEYAFNITIPSKINLNKELNEFIEKNVPNSLKDLSLAAVKLNANITTYKWELIACLDVEGVDVCGRQDLKVNS